MKNKFIIIPFIFLTSCASINENMAAKDINDFIDALKTRDTIQINNYIDKNSLKSEFTQIARDLLIKEAKSRGKNDLTTNAAILLGAEILKPMIEALADKLLMPENIAYFARQAGLKSDFNTPSNYRTSLYIKSIGDNSVCVPINQDNTKKCALYFRKLNSDKYKLYYIDEELLEKRFREIKK